ncbi:unnamed protein product [Periconia digitata]|uniref:Uncharacterized protein n=1 Tax=Periconia digitata TaxID=1303443 RepID=A0A9W4U4X9_9PLEO|nr:unnamed protein product [Periconia digitata]
MSPSQTKYSFVSGIEDAQMKSTCAIEEPCSTDKTSGNGYIISRNWNLQIAVSSRSRTWYVASLGWHSKCLCRDCSR